VRGNSEYAGLNSITCKHREGGKAVKTVTETQRERLDPLPTALCLTVLVTKAYIRYRGRCTSTWANFAHSYLQYRLQPDYLFEWLFCKRLCLCVCVTWCTDLSCATWRLLSSHWNCTYTWVTSVMLIEGEYLESLPKINLKKNFTPPHKLKFLHLVLEFFFLNLNANFSWRGSNLCCIRLP